MEMFGHPVAVYPDSELARLAAALDWLMIGSTHTNLTNIPAADKY